MSNILFCHGYTTKYVIMNGIFTIIIAWGIARSPRSGIFGTNWIRLICSYFFVTGNHKKTENEILPFITL
jgi:hypothetical protein